MQRYKNFIASLILLAFVASGVVWAKPVNKTDAEKAVKGWLKTNAKPLKANIGDQIVQTDVFNCADGTPAYYIVYLDPTGFVIVSADDAIEPVVGFVSSPAVYDPSPANPLGALVSQDMQGRINAARNLQKKLDAGVQKKDLSEAEKAFDDEGSKAKNKWSTLHVSADSLPPPTGIGSVSDVRVAPLVQSKWDQSDICGGHCYNYYTPTNDYAGCVATALAQVIRYFQWPTAGIGVHTFSISANGHGTTANTRGGDGNGGPYVWSQMLLVPYADCNALQDPQRQQIGSLCYDAGVAAHMEYAKNGSGAWVRNAKAALLNPFMYSNAVMGGDESTDIPAAGRNAMMNTSFDAGIPVQLAIYAGSNTGHSVVGDGYGYDSGTLYHHINMGWSGDYNAWYALPNINNFNTVVACVYNIYTSGTGEIISGRVTYSTGAPYIGATVTATGTGGPYTATTNDKGIYAFAKVRSNTTYTVTVTSAGCSFSPSSLSVTTGTSVDKATTTGNKWGNDFSTTCSPPAPPPAPAAINYPTTNGTGYYTVSWSSSSGAISYQLERSNDSGATWTSVYSGANLSYSENVGNGSYRYHVKATNGGGSSGWTTGTWDCVVTLGPPQPPQPPASITYPSTNSTGHYTVSWASSSGATSYELDRSNDGGISWTMVISGGSTSYAETVTNGNYRYRVNATNTVGTSDWTTGTFDCAVFIPPPVIVQFAAGTSAGWDLQSLASDIARNNTVDLNDLNVVAQHWLEADCAAVNQWCSGADMDDSNQVNFLDYALLTNDWGKQAGENVLLQTIYGNAQDSSGHITANSGHAIQNLKGYAMAFSVPSDTVLDKGTFKINTLAAGKTMEVRLFNVTGKGYLTTGHTMSRSDPGSGSAAIVDTTFNTPSSAPYHTESTGTQHFADMVINFGPLQVTAGDYLLTFDCLYSSSTSLTTACNIDYGTGTQPVGMGLYPDGTPLPKRATITSSAGQGNTYWYNLGGSTDAAYSHTANLFVFQIQVINNKPPVVDAGPDQQVTLSAIVDLEGTVTDDGWPNPPGYFTMLWTQQSGPDTVTFGNATFMGTTASFPQAGVYVLRLTANDGALSSYDEVTITVQDQP